MQQPKLNPTVHFGDGDPSNDKEEATSDSSNDEGDSCTDREEASSNSSSDEDEPSSVLNNNEHLASLSGVSMYSVSQEDNGKNSYLNCIIFLVE